MDSAGKRKAVKARQNPHAKSLKRKRVMIVETENKMRMNRCGADWMYCDGNCQRCSRRYATTATSTPTFGKFVCFAKGVFCPNANGQGYCEISACAIQSPIVQAENFAGKEEEE